MTRRKAPGSRRLLVLAAGLPACASQASDLAPCQGLAEIGTGELAFEPLSPDQELTVIAGPQGGHHFILNARMSGLEPGDPTQPGQASNPTTRFSIEQGGQPIHLDQPPYRLGYGDPEAGLVTLPGGRIVAFDEAFVPALDGARLRVAVEITDARGGCARDDAEVVAVPGSVPDGPDAGAIDAGIDAAL